MTSPLVSSVGLVALRKDEIVKRKYDSMAVLINKLKKNILSMLSLILSAVSLFYVNLLAPLIINKRTKIRGIARRNGPIFLRKLTVS